jgi:hypothetical protein
LRSNRQNKVENRAVPQLAGDAEAEFSAAPDTTVTLRNNDPRQQSSLAALIIF